METTPGLDFTAIDFKAANSDRSSACAVGVAAVRAGIITHTRSWLILPHTGLDSFDRYATRVHGIDASMVAAAPSLEDSMHTLAGLIETWKLSGLRSGRSVILIRGDTRNPGEIRDKVHVDTLADDYEHVGCDHENHCCTLHRTHVMPHRGCMMR